MDIEALKSLAPEELDALREALSGMESHGDEAEDKALIRPLVEAVKMIAEKVDLIDQKVDDMSDHYFNQFIGGITKLYEDNVRTDGLSAIKAKYGEMIGPFEGLAKELGGEDSDIYSEMYDHIKSHYDDEDFDPDDWVDELISKFNERKEKLGRLFSPAEKVVEVKTEGKIPPEKSEGLNEDEIRKLARSMKGR